VPGISLREAKQQNPSGDYRAAEREVGRTLAQMHAITRDTFGYATLTAVHYPSWREAFAAMIEGVLLDGEEIGVELPLSYDETRARMQEAYPVLDEVKTPHLAHWDLWDGNIFINTETCQLTGIIDFERAMWADPLVEQNFIGFTDPTAFLEGYGKRMPVTPNEHLRRTLYNIHLFLIIVIEHYYRQYPSNELEQWGENWWKNSRG
jgi:aminoglycoside phosphotransferase (APT) family kinase protein